MRVYEDVLDEMELLWVFHDRLEETDAQPWWLGESNELDETSDREDPEMELRKERYTTQAFVQAAQDALAAEALRRDFECKAMELEDLRSRTQAQ